MHVTWPLYFYSKGLQTQHPVFDHKQPITTLYITIHSKQHKHHLFNIIPTLKLIKIKSENKLANVLCFTTHENMNYEIYICFSDCGALYVSAQTPCIFQLTVGDRRVKGRRRSVSRLIGQIMCSKQKVCMWVPLSQCIGPICTPLCARES